MQIGRISFFLLTDFPEDGEMSNAWSNLAVNILIRIFMQNECSMQSSLNVYIRITNRKKKTGCKIPHRPKGDCYYADYKRYSAFSSSGYGSE